MDCHPSRVSVSKLETKANALLPKGAKSTGGGGIRGPFTGELFWLGEGEEFMAAPLAAEIINNRTMNEESKILEVRIVSSYIARRRQRYGFRMYAR